MTLTDRIEELVEQHGGLRKAARAVRIDPGYLSRLRAGEKDEPSATTLRKLGLKRMVYYARASTTASNK